MDKVLVVDDEPHWQEVFRDIFFGMGFDVDAVGRVEQAKAKLATSDYQLLVLDVVLTQGTSTLEAQMFLRFLQARHPQLPVVAASGKELSYLDVFGLPELGVRAFIHKPGIRLHEMEQKVRHVLADAASPSPASAARASEHIRYDAFISYCRLDGAYVIETIVKQLERRAVSVCIDVRDFEPGAPRATEIDRCIQQSRRTLLVLTPAYLASEWTELESLLVQALDPTNRSRRLIPLLLESCDLPLRIKVFTFVDLTGVVPAEGQLERLADAIKASR